MTKLNAEVTMGDILRHVTNSADFNEQRKTARLDIPIKVEYRVIGDQCSVISERKEKTKNAVTKDISAGGCLLLVTE
ncbi:MAG: hypothetical protein Q8O01_01655 [Candidatus Omnitrophota bacterium]|nr:hypothetical protein [Candidatus Omnitrophota bacterium]